MKHYAKKASSVIACLLLIVFSLAGCASTTSQSVIPLIFQYNDGNQISYVKALWSPEKGTMEISKEPILSYPINDAQFLALHWESADSVIVFTREATANLSNLQANGAKVNVVSLAGSLPSYFDPVVAYTTTQAVYAKTIGGQETTISKITATGMQQYHVNNGRYLGMGALNEKTYVLVGSPEVYTGTGAHEMTMSIILDIINPDGSITTKTVTENYDASMLTMSDPYIPFADGCFYFGGFRLDATSEEPKLVEATSLTNGFQVISNATSLPPFTQLEEMPPLKFSKYKDCLVVIGQTIGPTELTIAAFKNDNLVGFSLIMPYTMVSPMPENMKTSHFYTYNENAKQLNTYSIQTPLQIIVPQS